MNQKNLKTVAVIVAHPDDETLWTGGMMLSHGEWNVFIGSLCRASDTNRAPKFFQALKVIGAKGKKESKRKFKDKIKSYIKKRIFVHSEHN